MDVTIAIGREVEGTNVYKVPSNYTRTSRYHATLHWQNGVATLEDRSTNGTFVNGRRITRTTIQEGDSVWLGGNGMYEQGFQVDVQKLFVLCREAASYHRDNYSQDYTPNYRNREFENHPHQDYSLNYEPDRSYSNNYSKEFTYIKRAYIDYHAQLSKLKRKTNLKMQLPRVLLSIIPIAIVLTIILIFREKLGMMSIILMSTISLLGGLISVLTMGRSSSRQEKLSEDILDLQLKYQKEYRCPKCGKDFSLDLHWKRLEAEGKCPYGCGAKFV